LEWWTRLVVPTIIATSLLAIPVVDVLCFFMGFGAVIPRMANIIPDLARHLRFCGFDDTDVDAGDTLVKLI
jgi:hypothetical protein